MQRPAELVPIPEYLLSTSLVPPWYLLGTSLVPPEGFGKLLHFGKIPKTFGQHLARIQQKFSRILAKFAKILSKISIKFSNL